MTSINFTEKALKQFEVNEYELSSYIDIHNFVCKHIRQHDVGWRGRMHLKSLLNHAHAKMMMRMK